MSNTGRIFGLDAVRAVAILTVVIYHSAPILTPLGDIRHIGPIIHKLLSLTEPGGILGVSLFFVLSGFLIGSILIKIYIRTNEFGFADIKSFLIRRWFRTLPNYWLILTASIILYTVLGIQTFDWSYIRYYLFIQNLWYDHPSFFPEAWSLAIEEWFYLTMPFALLLFSKVLKSVTKSKILLYTILVYIFTFLLIRILRVDLSQTDSFYFDTHIRKQVIMRLDAISFGVLAAYFQYFHPSILSKHKKTLFYIGISGVVLLTAFHFIGTIPSLNIFASNWTYRLIHNIFFLTLIPLFYSLIIPLAYATKTCRHSKFANGITLISKVSYSMYLVHFTLILRPFWNPNQITTSTCIPIYLAYWALVIGISYFLFRFFETPAMNLRTKFSKEDPSV